MRKFFPILLFVLAFSNGYSQEYKKFRVGVGGGVGYYNTNGNSFPMLSLMYLEPSFRITDNVAVGYKIEMALPLLEHVISSQSITGQYYFSKNSLRPFVGAGIGIFDLFDSSKSGLMCDCGTTTEQNKIGFFPRVGFDFHHLTFNFEYNWMTPFKQTTTSIYPMPVNTPEPPPTISYYNASYLSAKVGVTIGGGEKKK